MKSYAKNGYGQVCGFDSKRKRDAFVKLVNEKIAKDAEEYGWRMDKKEFMMVCPARDAYRAMASDARAERNGKVGFGYYDMNTLEYYDGEWAVLDQMPA